jgi:phosphonate transport system substrate-binding protein
MTRLLVIILLLLGCTPAGTVSAEPVTFGIVPQQSASRLAELWGPIAVYLGEKTGLEIQFRTAPDIPAFEQRLSSGEYDIAYMNPYHYTVFHEAPGYSAIAKARDKRIKGIIVVRKESPIEKLEQLDGEQLAFPAPAAFAASILTRSHLKAIGIEFTPRYVSSHDSVYSSVAKGFFAAGGGVIRTFRNTEPAIREQLRILWTTPGYTPHAIAIHPRTDAATSGKLADALLGMERDEAGRKLLEAIKVKGFEQAADSDWDDVRALSLDEIGTANATSMQE